MEHNTEPSQSPDISDEISAFNEEALDKIYRAVFRPTTNEPGFYHLDLGTEIDSKAFRKQMVELKERLSRTCQLHQNKQLNYQWMSRTNHRNSSQFHIDTAPEQSILMLGYEPSTVESKVYLADYTRFLEENELSAQDYFRNSINGNFAPNDEELTPYVSELTPFPKDHYRIVVINNSRSFGQKTYGVFHRGEVPDNLVQEDRLVNAIMLAVCESGIEETYGDHMIKNFMTTDQADQ